MAMRLLSLPTSYVIENPGVPDRDQTLIPEHLQEYLRRVGDLPALTVRVDAGGQATVTRGHKYLRIAVALGHERVRAVVDANSDALGVQAILGRPGVNSLDWDSIRASEAVRQTPQHWHVVFFERELSEFERHVFLDAMRRCFGAELTIDDATRSDVVAFCARTPVADEAFGRDLLASLVHFSEAVVGVVSYQGRKFLPNAG